MTFKINSVVTLKRSTMVGNKQLIRPGYLGRVTEVSPYKVKVEFEVSREKHSAYFNRTQLSLQDHD
jgi:hypothetical protein